MPSFAFLPRVMRRSISLSDMREVSIYSSISLGKKERTDFLKMTSTVLQTREKSHKYPKT